MSRKPMLTGATLQPFEAKVEFFVERMEIIRAGMNIARACESDERNDDLHVMEMGLRCLWGICAGAMAFDDTAEDFAAWGPRANSGWQRLSKYMGQSVEIATKYLDNMTPLGYGDFKMDKSINAFMRKRHQARIPGED